MNNEELIPFVGYKIIGVNYYIATERLDITADQVVSIYKLGWDIKFFFKWWKKHLKAYHLIARSQYGFLVQILGGLITYLLIAIYCHEQFNEPVSVKKDTTASNNNTERIAWRCQHG